MTIETKMESEIQRLQFLQDVLCTAIDSGIGYWAQVKDYYYTGEGLAIDAGALVNTDNAAHDWYSLDFDAINVGITRILIDPDFQINDQLRAAIYLADLQNDASEIDALAADAIVQAALFGELVYG